MNASTDRLSRDAEFLTELHPARNYQNETLLEKAARYIEDEFREAHPAICKIITPT